VPVLVESFPEMGDRRFGPRRLGEDYTLRGAIVDRWNVKHPVWRTWNLSRSRARWLVQNHVEARDGLAPQTGQR